MKKTDLLIIGAGPAGCSAAIYAVRAGLKTVIAGGAMPGGQLLQTSEIENYAGFIDPVVLVGHHLVDVALEPRRVAASQSPGKQVVKFQSVCLHISFCFFRV